MILDDVVKIMWLQTFKRIFFLNELCKVAPNRIGILTNLGTSKNTFHFFFLQSVMSCHVHELAYSIRLRCPNKLLQVGCTQVCHKCFNGELHTFFTMCIKSSKWWMNSFGQYSKVWNAQKNLKRVHEKITMIGSPNLRVSNICFYWISTTFFHKVAHTFIVVCDGGGQFSSRPFNKWFDSFWNGWSIDKNILCSSIIIFFKSSKVPCIKSWP